MTRGLRGYDEVEISEQELEQAIEKGVERAFMRLGLSIADEKEIREDFNWLRQTRRSYSKIHSYIAHTVIVAIVGGLILAFWSGLTYLIHKM